MMKIRVLTIIILSKLGIFEIEIIFKKLKRKSFLEHKYKGDQR